VLAFVPAALVVLAGVLASFAGEVPDEGVASFEGDVTSFDGEVPLDGVVVAGGVVPVLGVVGVDGVWLYCEVPSAARAADGSASAATDKAIGRISTLRKPPGGPFLIGARGASGLLEATTSVRVMPTSC
jgi:hypothetical protein